MAMCAAARNAPRLPAWLNRHGELARKRSHPLREVGWLARADVQPRLSLQAQCVNKRSDSQEDQGHDHELGQPNQEAAEVGTFTQRDTENPSRHERANQES